MLRWSVVTATPMAIYWTIFYLVNGSVPTTLGSQIDYSQTTILWDIVMSLTVPSGISRWADILIGPACSIAIIGLRAFYLSGLSYDEKPMVTCCASVGIIGLTVGLINALEGGFIGLMAGLDLGLVSMVAVASARMLPSRIKRFWDWLSVQESSDPSY